MYIYIHMHWSPTCHGTESSGSNSEWKTEIFIWNTPKYSGREENNGRAGVDLSAVQVQISAAVQVQ